jgi:thymidylate kinase
MVFGRLFQLVLGPAVDNDAAPGPRETRFKRFDAALAAREALNHVSPAHGVPAYPKTLETCMMVLRIARNTDPLLANSPRLDAFFEYLAEVERNTWRLSRGGFQDVKVLCVEGLPGSGKSTLAHDLAESASTSSLGVRFVVATLPAEVTDVRQMFRNSSAAAAAALDFALNYCIAYGVVKGAEAHTSSSSSSSSREQIVVVVDEFYHAACARAVTSRAPADSDLRALPASAFEWPIDLPIPNLVIYLMAPAESRHRSLMDSLGDHDQQADERAELAYSLVTGPPTIALDASEAPAVVAAQAVDACEEFGLFVRRMQATAAKAHQRNKRVSMGIYGELPVVYGR